jgi:hypothetical protein
MRELRAEELAELGRSSTGRFGRELGEWLRAREALSAIC